MIDDDKAIREAFTLALEDTEYQVETVESGEKGLKKTQTTKYDLIFLDLKMPGMNGVKTLRELQKIDKDVPVYLITAFHKEFFDELAAAEEEGMNFEVVKKPISSDQIIVIIKSILEKPQTF